LSFTLFVVINLISTRLPTPIPEQALEGKRVWQRHNCVSCHTLFGNGGYKADDLTHIVAKHNPSQLVEYLVQPPVMRPNTYTRHPALDAEEASQGKQLTCLTLPFRVDSPFLELFGARPKREPVVVHELRKLEIPCG
jgi:hypothetical protein